MIILYRNSLNIIAICCILTFQNVDAQWIETSGTHGNSITSFAANDSLMFVSVWSGGVFTSSDNGLNWTQKNNGLPTPYVSRIIFDNGEIFAGTNQGIFISTDNGENWTLRNNSLTIVEAFNFMNSNFLIGDWNNGFVVSTDRGISWSAYNNGLTNFNITTVYTIGSNIYLVTYGGGVFLSTNFGSDWIAKNNGITNDTLSSLINLGNYYFVSGWGTGIFRSTDQGNSWTRFNNGLTSLKALSFVSSSNIIFVTAYEGGVFSSHNYGESWNPVNTGLTTLKVQQLFIDNDYIFVGVSGGKVFSRNLSEITSIDPDNGNESPIDFKLYQNYPNPFNPVTTITYDIPEQSFVTITVYDVLGNEITTLVDEEKPVGRYKVEFNVTGLASGIYIYRLKTIYHAETQKMVLIK